MRIAVSGLQAANMQLAAAASSIVNMDSSDAAASAAAGGPPDPAGPPISYPKIAVAHSDLVSGIVNLDQAALGFKADLAVYRAASRMFKSLLDMTA